MQILSGDTLHENQARLTRRGPRAFLTQTLNQRSSRCRFFDNTRGSALEPAVCFDVTVAKKFASAAEIQIHTAILVQIVSMLFGLIRADSDVRVFEQAARYRVEGRKYYWE